MTNNAMGKEKKYLLLNWILLAGYGCITLFAVVSSIYSWPTQGSIIWFFLIIFCPPFLYHLFFIGYVSVLKQRPHRKKSYRFITMLCGVLLAGAVLQMTQKISLAHFESAYQPMIVQIQEQMPSPCDSHYFEIPEVYRYNHSVTQKLLQGEKPIGGLLYNPQRFVLHFRASSVDMDNATIFYDSESKNWRFFHHDNVAEMDNFTARSRGLTPCKTF